MDCPCCRIPMWVVEYASVEVDACPSCRGAWLDEGELDLLAGSLGLPPARQTLASLVRSEDEAEKPRRCPRCRRRMDKARLGGAGPVVDACPRGQGIWFDRGELGQVLEASAAGDAAGRVVAFLRDVLPGEFPRKEDR